MAKIVYRQMLAHRGLPPKNPRTRAKIRMQKPQSGGNFGCKSPGARGGVVMTKIDSLTTVTQVHCLVSSRVTVPKSLGRILADIRGLFFWVKNSLLFCLLVWLLRNYFLDVILLMIFAFQYFEFLRNICLF